MWRGLLVSVAISLALTTSLFRWLLGFTVVVVGVGVWLTEPPPPVHPAPLVKVPPSRHDGRWRPQSTRFTLVSSAERVQDCDLQPVVDSVVIRDPVSERPAPSTQGQLKSCLKCGRGPSRKQVQIREEVNVTYEIPSRYDPLALLKSVDGDIVMTDEGECEEPVDLPREEDVAPGRVISRGRKRRRSRRTVP